MQDSLARVEYWGSVAQWIERGCARAEDHLARVSHTLRGARPAAPGPPDPPFEVPDGPPWAPQRVMDAFVAALADLVILYPERPPEATLAQMKAAAPQTHQQLQQQPQQAAQHQQSQQQAHTHQQAQAAQQQQQHQPQQGRSHDQQEHRASQTEVTSQSRAALAQTRAAALPAHQSAPQPSEQRQRQRRRSDDAQHEQSSQQVKAGAQHTSHSRPAHSDASMTAAVPRQLTTRQAAHATSTLRQTSVTETSAAALHSTAARSAEHPPCLLRHRGHAALKTWPAPRRCPMSPILQIHKCMHMLQARHAPQMRTRPVLTHPTHRKTRSLCCDG